MELGYDYLKHTLKLPFPNLRAREIARQQEEAERQARTAQLLLEKYERLRGGVMDEERREMEDALKQMVEYFKMLFPKTKLKRNGRVLPDDNDELEESDEEEEEAIDWNDVEQDQATFTSEVRRLLGKCCSADGHIIANDSECNWRD